jgi:ABC-2 type transport system permease protein
MNFIVMPIFFLSGALFPLTGLPFALKILTGLDPLSYGVDGLRNALISAVHFGFALDTLVLCVTGSLFLGLSTYFFSRIEI